ncbi:MAG: hypothetical protein WAW80_00705 [Candidatus Saccharimonadales bacterium]
MDMDNRREDKSSSEHADSHSPRTYDFLLQFSRRLGTVATNSSFLHDIKSFLNQEIVLPSSDKIFAAAFQRNNDAVKKDEQQRVETRTKDLRKLVEKSHEVLMSVNTVFPISLFPDTVTVDRTKVTIVKRDFFWSSDVMSIRIEDVLNVSATVGPLFGSLTVASRVMSTLDHFTINHFWRNDAIYLKRIIQGYVIAQHNKIDTAHLEKKELIETLIELGQDSN